jgi:hypothetical protein
VAQEWQRKAEHLKAKGNDLYRDSEFTEAIICYEEAYFNLASAHTSWLYVMNAFVSSATSLSIN